MKRTTNQGSASTHSRGGPWLWESTGGRLARATESLASAQSSPLAREVCVDPEAGKALEPQVKQAFPPDRQAGARRWDLKGKHPTFPTHLQSSTPCNNNADIGGVGIPHLKPLHIQKQLSMDSTWLCPNPMRL